MSQIVASSEADSGPGYGTEVDGVFQEIKPCQNPCYSSTASVEMGTWASLWHRITVIWK